MRAEVQCTVPDEAAGVVQLAIGQLGVKAGYHDICLFLIAREERNARLAEVPPQLLGTDQVHRFSGIMAVQVCHRDVSGGHDLVRRRLKSQSFQLIDVERRGV